MVVNIPGAALLDGSAGGGPEGGPLQGAGTALPNSDYRQPRECSAPARSS